MSHEVPQDWLETEIGEVAEIQIGGTPSRGVPSYWAQKAEEGLPWLSIADMRAPEIFRTKERITASGAKNSNVKLIKAGTVLMSFKLSIGKVAIAGVPLYTNEAIAAFTPNTTKLENSFLRYALPHFVGHVETDQAVKGVTLNKAKLKSLVLLLPPLHEQRRIAEILSSVDDAIAATRAVIEQTRKVKQGVLERLLTKGIGHTRFKQTEIGEIPEGWEAAQVGQFARLQPGYAFKSAEFADSGVRLLRGSNVGVGSFDWSEGVTKHFPAERIGEFSEYLLGENDIIIAMDRPFISTGFKVARLKKTDLPCLLLQRVGRLIPMADCDPGWLWQITSAGSVRTHLEKQQVGTDLPHISRSDVESCTVALPPLSEQKAIAAMLEPFDIQLDLLTQNLFSEQRLKSALMSDLLTGRKRVTDALPMAAE